MSQRRIRPRKRLRSKKRLSPLHQVQCLASSADLVSWEKYPGNPVIAEPPRAFGVCFRDPCAWKEGDTELSRLKQERIAKAAERIAGELGIPGVKYAMDFNGYFGGAARLPLLPLTADLKAEVERMLADIRN